MGTNKQGNWPTNTEPSWTDDALPMDLRRRLLDRALDEIKAQKGLVHGHPGNQGGADHPGESGSESPDHND
jgi:hypothetical protein